MQGLADDKPEIGYGMTAAYAKASRAELDQRFAEMNAGPLVQRGRVGTPN
jgi:hypothetical protein